MKKSCTPVSDLMLGPFQAYFPTAGFLVGSLEREQWLNLEGLYAYWFQAGLGQYPATHTGTYATRPNVFPGFCERTSS